MDTPVWSASGLEKRKWTAILHIWVDMQDAHTAHPLKCTARADNIQRRVAVEMVVLNSQKNNQC